MTTLTAKADSSAQTGNKSERREGARAPLAARIEILKSGTDAAITGRISDLSLGGCYADAINTFPEGTAVEVRIAHHGEIVELSGDVRFEHPGLGIGIGFRNVTPQQRNTLNTWLGMQGASADEPVVEVRDGARIVSTAHEKRLIALIELLTRKGVLSSDEKLELLEHL
jgi:hypothetical protein